MLERITAMSTSKDFVAVAIDLMSERHRAELLSELADSSLVFRTDDLWCEAVLNNFSDTHYGTDDLIFATASEEDSVKILHRLQLLAHYNQAVKAPIEKLLAKVCL